MSRRGERVTTTLVQTERQFQDAVVQFAKLHGWKAFHPYDSRRSEPGWPDLTLVRGNRIAFAELKTDQGKLSAAQQNWIWALRANGHVEVYVWRPKDWDEMERFLR